MHHIHILIRIIALIHLPLTLRRHRNPGCLGTLGAMRPAASSFRLLLETQRLFGLWQGLLLVRNHDLRRG
jgi:hypothetical protein